MDSDVNGAASTFEACDFDNLRQEDCQYILRALEKKAFEYVVCALRAQGPLSQYKEIILDHLKSLLFISDEEFLLRVRLTANDPVLSRIAQELNPSYDISSEWMAAGYSLVSMDFPKIVQLNSTAPNANASSIAEKMQREMAKHNSHLIEEQNALLKVLQLTKKPFVPEKLRRLLQDSEKDTHGRIDTLREKTAPMRVIGRPRRSAATKAIQPVASAAVEKSKLNKETEKTKVKKESTECAPSKVKATLTKEATNGEPATTKVASLPPAGAGTTFAEGGASASTTGSNETSNIAKSAAKLSAAKPASKNIPEMMTNGKCVETVANSTVAPSTVTSSETSVCVPGPSGVSLNNVSTAAVTENGFTVQQKVAIKTDDVENNKDLGEFSIHYSGGANVVIVDPEDQNTVKEQKVRKRRSKVVDDVTCTCARVLPFIFEAAVDGQTKPPRGNPDKRCSKLKTSKRVQGYTTNNDLINFNVPQQQMGLAPPNSYYSPKNVSYFNSTADMVPSKRLHSDEPEENRLISNVMYHQKSQHRLMGTPINIMTNSSYSATPRSYYGGGPSSASSSTSIVTSGRPPAPQHSSYGQSNCGTSNSTVSTGDMTTYNSHHYYATGKTGAGTPRMTGSASCSSTIAMGYGAAASDASMDDAVMVTYGGKAQEMDGGFIDETGRRLQSPSSFTTPTRRLSRRTEHTVDGNSAVADFDYVSSDSTQQPCQEQQQTTQEAFDFGGYSKNVPQVDYNRSYSSTMLVHSHQTQREFVPNNTKERTEGHNNASAGAGSASGLDFLASTASLLIPMQKQQSDNQMDQQQQFYTTNTEPTQTTLLAVSNQSPQQQQMVCIQSSMPTVATVIHQQNNYSESSPVSNCFSTVPATSSAMGFVPTAAQQQSLQLQWASHEQKHQQPTHHSTTCYHHPAVTVPIASSPSTIAPPSTTTVGTTAAPTFSADNEAAQNFLKQHASLMDTNGVLLNEEITLGSILRSSNLRNKLLSAAGKSSSASPSPSANSPASASSASVTGAVGTCMSWGALGTSATNTSPVTNAASQSTFPSTRQSQKADATISSAVRSAPVLSSGLRMEDLQSVPFETTRDFVVLSEGVTPTSVSTLPPATVSGQEN